MVPYLYTPMSFEWFIFQPLPQSLFNSCVPSDCPERTQAFWQAWTTNYDHACYIFYRQQLEEHWQLLARDFCRSRGLNSDTPTDYVEDYEWRDEWRDVLDLNPTYNAHREAFELWNSRRQKPVKSADFLWEALGTKDMTLVKHWSDTKLAAKAQWFSFNIPDQSPTAIAELKRLPPNAYLGSHYWRRVRSALILINNSMCEQCQESFAGDWPDLWVRRMQYNTGEERYPDLKLLCKIHHLQSTGRG